MRRHSLLVLIPLMLFGANARADGDPPATPAAQQAAAVDVIVLKNGTRLEGEVVGEDDRAVSLKSGGVTRTYMKDSIASVEKAPRAAAPSDPAGQPGAAPPAPAEPAKGKKGKGERRDAPLSEAAKRWLDELVAKTANADDDVVRRSVTQAIQALGPSAIPALRAAQTAAPDGPQKQFLDRLASDMEQKRDRRGEGMGPDGGGPGGRPAQARRALDDMMQKLTTELELKDDQKPKVEAVLADFGKKRFEAFAASRRDGLSQEQMQEKVAALRTDMLAQMKAVLTEPQYALFEAEAAKLFEAQRGGMPPKPPAKPADGDQPMPPEKPPEPAK
jgi:sRNA-binding regulator protein Hfq